jgi:hypothetical protein
MPSRAAFCRASRSTSCVELAGHVHGLPAEEAGWPDHPLNPYFARLCARRGHKITIIAVAQRLCRIIFAMLRHQSDFDVAKLGIERGPFEHKIVRAYRLKASSQ